jgi:hypothetical protein
MLIVCGATVGAFAARFDPAWLVLAGFCLVFLAAETIAEDQ